MLIKSQMRFGEIAVSAHLVTAEQLKKALKLQAKSDRTLGEVMVENGFMHQTDVDYVIGVQKSLRNGGFNVDEVATVVDDPVDHTTEAIHEVAQSISRKLDGGV